MSGQSEVDNGSFSVIYIKLYGKQIMVHFQLHTSRQSEVDNGTFILIHQITFSIKNDMFFKIMLKMADFQETNRVI